MGPMGAGQGPSRHDLCPLGDENSLPGLICSYIWDISIHLCIRFLSSWTEVFWNNWNKFSSKDNLPFPGRTGLQAGPWNCSEAPPPSSLGQDDSGQNPQIFTGRWEIRSVTKRRWLVMPRKLLGGCYTPHQRCTCDRILNTRQKQKFVL